jgi:capsular polysaccharide biosynthesis protein
MKILDKYFKMRKNNQLSHKIFKTSNYKKYALENKLIFVTKQCSKNTLVYNPVYVRNGNIKQMQTVQQPEIYISELNDVTVFSECSAVLTQDNKVLFDMAFHPEAKRYNFKDNFLRYADKSNSILYLNKDNRIVIDECIMLCGTASRNYYHWLFEFLTRLSLIEGEIRYNKFPLLIDEAVLEISQMAEVLRLFSDGHRFIILPQNSRCHVKKLIVPSYLVWMPINLRKNEKIKSTDSVISIEAVNFLRNKISSVLQNEEFKYRGRKFYISRKTCKTGYRKLLNEDKVIEVFVKHGFDIIYPETMTFTEQYRIFSTAASIAGATGAGLTNIVFAPRECIIFCLINKPIDFSVYSTIAGIIGQTMLFIDGERESCFNTTDLEYQSDFKINVKDLDRVLIKEMKTVNGVEN